MNGVHDLGGMQDMGPVQVEKNEPVFHEPWQARAFACTRAMGGWRKWNLDAMRCQREQIAPVDYFRMSYYERWIVALVELMLKNGMVTPAELESGKSDPGSAKLTPPLTAEKAQILVTKGVPESRDVAVTARFHTGERVRARNINPVGHTRLVRYARGKTGTIHMDHGVFLFPDTNALFLGESPSMSTRWALSRSPL